MKQFHLAVASLMALGLVGNLAWAQCPTNQDEVDAFVAACRASDADCESPATTCNGEFSIALAPLTRSGSEVTYTYTICKLTPDGNSRRGGTPGLSHWVLGVELACLQDGMTLADIVTSYKINGVEYFPEFMTTDPTTGINGIKVEEFPEFGQGECLEFAITFDEALVEDGCHLGVGNVPAATKGGKQDIRDPDSRDGTPGYACICGPVCICDDDEEEQCETAWGYLPGQSHAFLDPTDCGIIANKWGWAMEYTITDDASLTVAELWAGAGQNDFDKGELIGNVTISDVGGLLFVQYNLVDGWVISGGEGENGTLAVWVGDDLCDIPTNAAPGQFDSQVDLTSGTTTYSFFIDLPADDDFSGTVWIAAHAEVCLP